MRNSDRFAPPSGTEAVPDGARVRNSIELESLSTDKSRYNARGPGTFQSNTTPRTGENPTGRRGAPALNPGTRVCACFTSAPRLFADSKLCRTMPAAPLSHSWIIKREKRKGVCGCAFVGSSSRPSTPQPIDRAALIFQGDLCIKCFLLSDQRDAFSDALLT